MADADRVVVELTDGVAEVRLNRPDKMNALDPGLFEALVAAGDRLAAEPGLRAVVLCGAGRGFCAGLDMASFSSPDGFPADLAGRTHGAANGFQQVAMQWRRIPVPVLAAVHGVAFGGGFQIMLGADIRYVAPDAKLSVMEIRWGIVPDMGGTVLMRALARSDVVRELTFTGRVFSGAEAATLGFATRVEADPLAAARAAARDIAARSPDAMRAAKRLLNAAEAEGEERLLLAESVEQQALLGSANQREAVAANMAGRAPAFRDAAIGEPGR